MTKSLEYIDRIDHVGLPSPRSQNPDAPGTFAKDVLVLSVGTKTDYLKLAQYHYRTENIGPVSLVYKISARFPYTNVFPDPLAVNVYSPPIARLKIRNTVLKHLFVNCVTQADRLAVVNKNILYGSRLIVDPRFRRFGLARKLLEESMARIKIPIIETLTPIDPTNKLLESLGFTKYYNPAPTRYRRLRNYLLSLGISEENLRDPVIVHSRLCCLSDKDKADFEHQLQMFSWSLRKHEREQHSIKRTKYIVGKLYYPEAYFVWYNPSAVLSP